MNITRIDSHRSRNQWKYNVILNFLARLNEALNALLITGILIHASYMPYTLLSQGEGGGGGGLNVTIMMMCITCMMSWLSLIPRDFIVRYQCVGKFPDILSKFFLHIGT